MHYILNTFYTSDTQTSAYQPKAQSMDLHLPRLPNGSLSTPEELKARLNIGDGDDQKKKSKKRKHEDKEQHDVPVKEEKAEKKHKKKSKV
jgi:hypothetical protein